MKVQNFMPDGFEQDGYIEGVALLFNPMRFRFRPINSRRRVANARTARQITDQEKREEFYLKCLAARIKEWDIVDDDGSPVPITGENCGDLQGELLGRLHAIVSGTRASDPDPLWSDEAKAENESVRREADETGQLAGDVQQERAEKN